MGILSSLKYKNFEKALIRLNFKIVRQKGSHVLFKNNEGKIIVIPHHKGKNIKEGLAHKIITKEMKITIEEFKKLI